MLQTATPTETPIPKLLTPAEVVAYLGIAKVTLWRWNASGRLPAPIEIAPKVYRWTQESIDDWVSQLKDEAQEKFQAKRASQLSGASA